MNGTVSPATGRTFLTVSEIIRKYVQPKPKEGVLIVADTESDATTIQAIAAASHFHKAEPVIMTVPPTFLEGTQRDMPPAVFKALEEVDIYFPMTATTGHSIHVKEVAAALYDKDRKKNIRCFVFAAFYGAGITSAIDALRTHDYHEVMRLGKQFEQYFMPGKEVRVTSQVGTDFTASIEGIPYRAISALALEPGQIGGINIGECYGGPVEFTAEGTIVIDGAFVGVAEGKAFLDEPITVKVKGGKVIDIKGGQEAAAFKRIIETTEGADVFAEVSAGTNPFLRLNGDIRGNDKWVLGTMHVAFGQTTFQIYPYGTNDCEVHCDALLTKPSCWVDGKQILKDGVPLIFGS